MPATFWTTMSGLGGAVTVAALFYWYGPKLWEITKVDHELARSKQPGIERPKPMAPWMRFVLAFVGLAIGGGLGYWVAYLVTAHPANVRAASAETRLTESERQLAAAQSSHEFVLRQVMTEQKLGQAERALGTLASDREFDPALQAMIPQLRDDIPEPTELADGPRARSASLLAQLALEEGAPERALEYVKHYSGGAVPNGLLSSQRVSLMRALADSLRRCGNYVDAHAEYAALLQEVPDDMAALLDDGYCALQLEEWELAIARLRRVEQRFLALPPVEQSLGRNRCLRRAAKLTLSAVLLEMQPPDPATAIQVLQDLLRDNPQNAPARTNLANAYELLGNPELALQEYRQAAADKPRLFMVRWNYGLAAASRGDFESSAREFAACCEIEPSRPEAHYNLGSSLLELGKATDAIPALTRAIEAGFRDETARCQRGIAYTACRNFRMAKLDLEATIQEYPDFAFGHLALARLLAQMRDWPALDQRLGLMKERWPEDPHTRLGIAELLLDAGKDANAVGEYEIAVRLNPADAGAFGNYGIALVRCARYEEAIEQLTKAVEMDGSLAPAIANRAFAFEKLGRFDLALPDRELDAKLRPTRDASVMELALLQDTMGLTARAVDSWKQLRAIREQAYSKNQTSANAALLAGSMNDLGMALVKTGQVAEGFEQYTAARALLEAIPTADSTPQFRRYLANVYNNICAVLADQGRSSEVITILTQAVERWNAHVEKGDADARKLHTESSRHLGRYTRELQDRRVGSP